MSYKVYGPNGEYQGEIQHHDGAGEGFAILFLLGTVCLMIFAGLSSLWEYLEHWTAHRTPFNYVSAFYYFFIHGVITIFTFPYKLGVDFFEYLTWLHITPYKNVNLIISLGIKTAYVVLAIFLVWQVLKVVYKLFCYRVARLILVAPAIFGVVSFCAMWLFEM